MSDQPVTPDELARIMRQSLDQTVQSLRRLQEGVAADIRDLCGKIGPGPNFKPGNFEQVEKELARQQAQMAARLEALASGLVNDEIFAGVSKTVEAAARTFEEMLKKFEDKQGSG